MATFFTEFITWETDSEPGSDITLFVRHSGAFFRICYVAGLLAESTALLEQHRESYTILSNDNPDGFVEEVERLRKPFEDFMAQLVPNPPMDTAGYLHSYLYPPYFILEAKGTASGDLQPHFREALSRQKFDPPGEYTDGASKLQIHLRPLLDMKFDTCSSRQVKVQTYTDHLVPSQVCVNGAVYFFKPWPSRQAFSYHQLDVCAKMLADTEPARISCVHSLVIDNDDDVLQHYSIDPNDDEEICVGTRLVGLLLTYIENKGTLSALAPWSDCTNEDRSRWARQVRQSVEHLHRAGIVWGDAKPENVLIDIQGDTWLIDFGGSYTQGWVDKENQETVEGDLQGLQRIENWLVKCSQRPVDRRT
ncbi:hypothetical protein QBC35DRAFT_547765 [Podospora australis]|uniref:Protein kinase domain-containing protein n=1 Tax=Podospora australis TaxID=1536484 RepID=A0AAN7ADW5_9PEZI|nr:hypothetical protein QBC35DRAFT_547765 [Podospora australis]